MKPLDLQALVAGAGGYDKITPAMWAAFDGAMDTYQRTRRDELIAEQASWRRSRS
jgi:hypothetical protein